MVLNAGQYMQSILKSTARRRRSISTMTRTSTVEVFTILRGISLLNTNIVTIKLGCSRVYVTGTLIGLTAKKITKAWIALAHAAGIRRSLRCSLLTSSSIVHKIHLRYWQEGKMAMLQDHRLMISQRPLVLEARRKG